MRHKGFDDPQVAQGFNQVANMPQMRLPRYYVARCAVAMKQAGQGADLGRGPGHLAIRLAQMAPGLHVTGVDLPDEMLTEAERHGRQSSLGNRTSFRKGDTAQIPFRDGSLGLGVSTLSLHHWSDPVAMFDEIARVLRPGGAFF